MIKTGQQETPSTRLDTELKAYQSELNKLSAENKKLLNGLEKKIEEEFPPPSSHFSKSHAKFEAKNQRKIKELSSDINAERIYLRQTLYSLEQRQISESIKRIGRSIVDEKGGSQRGLTADTYFEVWFEDAIVKEPVYLEEDYTESLNNLRKYSLFCIHKTGSKKQVPFYSHNVSSWLPGCRRKLYLFRPPPTR